MGAPEEMRCHGSTVMELLIAVGLLAVLVAFLMPSIQAGIDRAHASRCVGNLKQMHSGFMLYSADNDGKIPPYREFYTDPETGVTDRGAFWSERIKPYLTPDANGKTKYNLCPAEKTLPSTHYGMNTSISMEEQQVQERLTATLLHAQRFLLGDANGQSRLRVTVFGEDAAFRHPGKRMNLVFLDGHVEARTYREIPVPANGFAKTSAQYKAFWSGTQ